MNNSSPFISRLFCAFLLSAFSLSSLTFAQSDDSFTFQGVDISIPENIETISFDELNSKSGFNNTIYAWMQFNEIPNQAQQNAVKDGGVEVLNYIANATYLVSFDRSISREVLTGNNVKGIIPVYQEVKTESQIRNGAINSWAIDGDNVKLIVLLFKGVNMNDATTLLEGSGVKIDNAYPDFQTLEVTVPMGQINSIGDFNCVKWVEEITAPSVKDDTRGRGLHRANGLDTQTSTGRQYTGVGIGVMVRDDGIVGPHIDFEGRLDNSTATGTGQTHGDGVAGIMTGAGNLDPTKRGMAAGSDVYVSNYASNFMDAATVDRINNGTVQITNSSYSNGCNGGYTSTTVTVDDQAYNNPTLLHVFSAGNSGTSNCGYGAGSTWGNITGGHKQGKNVIATANTSFEGILENSSSRGPAYDGRIKPDIAANGYQHLSTDEDNDYLTFGGTSGAAPGIAGISAQLYELYGDYNGGDLPDAALIKASILNTANDAGNVGPDFKFGWGIVNGLRAGMLLEDGRHLSSSVSQGSSNSHTISVPAGTEQVRFMLYWSDPAAANGANTALINDLDLVVNDPGAGTYLPWLLDHTPNTTTLDLPATTGADHLNNMEQVLINNPTAGNYTIDVSGFAVPMGPQEYFVVYEIISDEITVTYPNRGEKMVPGEQESIHWDAPESSGSFDLEYSDDNGASWNTITTVASDIRMYDWTVPNTLLTGEGRVRVTRGGVSDVSDSTFSVAALVSGQTITQVCPTTVTFSWNIDPDAESYDVYVLGPQYMEVVGNATTNTFTHTITDPNDDIWYAVASKNATDGWESRRSVASYYAGGLLNCAFATDVELAAINNSSDFLSLCNTGDSYPEIQILNAGTSPISNFPVSYELSGQPVVTETYTGTVSPGQVVNYTFTTPLTVAATGTYTLTCTATVSGDGYAGNNEQTVDIYVQVVATATPFEEDFQATGFLPVGWTLNNPDNDDTWEEVSVTGASGASTDAAFVNNYAYNAVGEEDYIETEIFYIDGGMAMLSFDLAKVQYSNTYKDSLAVQISDDCGATWATIYAKGSGTLETANTVTSNWSPGSANDWRNETVDISSYLGENVTFRFINITGYGNSTYIDNINVMSDLSIGENDQVHFSLYPNPTNGTATLAISNQLDDDSKVVITNQLGQTLEVLPSSALLGNEVAINLTSYQRGVYYVTVYAGGLKTTKRIVKN
ncbi:MAG: S8 family serine peptidase [Crocinitomicaceae bacterium]|nr:S8 family serine peptidase [Crocinitomicaceae bacterium]